MIAIESRTLRVPSDIVYLTQPEDCLNEKWKKGQPRLIEWQDFRDLEVAVALCRLTQARFTALALEPELPANYPVYRRRDKVLNINFRDRGERMFLDNWIDQLDQLGERTRNLTDLQSWRRGESALDGLMDFAQ